MNKKIEGSVVAENGSTISNVSNNNNKNSNNINKTKRDFTIFGFILGVGSSIIASYIYDFMKHIKF